MNGLRLGIGFLTRVPMAAAAPAPGDWGRAARWFPLAGAFVAAFSVLALGAGSFLWTPLVGAVAAVAAAAWATGALHLDGLSDCFDGLACNGDPEKTLAVMRDPRAGAIGVVATVLVLAAKVALVAACVEAGTGAAAVWVACVLSRAFLPLEIALGAPATPGRGLFARLATEVGPVDAGRAAIVAGILVAPALALVPTMGAGIAVGLAGAGALTIWWDASWRERVGGLTGDVLGAAVELRELAILAALGTRWLG